MRQILFTFCCIVCLFCFQETKAQIQRIHNNNTNTTEIRGIITDSTGQGYVPYAHVFIVNQRDTTPLVASSYGSFTYNGPIADSMLVRVSAVGYKPFEEIYYPKKHGFYIQIRLTQDVISLNEIIIQGKIIAMVVKGDTLQYNAEAFTTLEGDFMDVLLKKMPGVKFGDRGLTVNGEPIAKIYVNGNDKLFSNPNDAIKHIEADNVKDIQVYDERKKEDQKLGLKYGERQTVMNVKTKRKVEAVKSNSISLQGGADVSNHQNAIFKEKYNLNLNCENYLPNRKISVRAYYSNWSPALTIESKKFGGNFQYSTKWNSGKINNSISSKYDNSTIYNNRQGEHIYFPTIQYNSRSYQYVQKNKKKNIGFNISDAFVATGNIGMLRLNADVKYNKRNDNQEDLNKSQIDGNTISSAQITNNNKEDHILVNTTLHYNKAFNKIGVNVLGTYNWEDRNGNGLRQDTLDESTRQILKIRDVDMRKQNGSINIRLSKALTPLWKLSGGVGYNYSKEKDQGEAKDLLTGLIDTTNTRDYSITYQGGSIGTSLKHMTSKTIFGINLGLATKQRKHVENFPTKEVMEDDYLYFTSGLDFQTKFSPTANIKFNYSTSCELPPMEDSRAVIDDANPLSLKVGNNNLKLPRKHHFKLNLNQTFIESASAIEFKMEYQILNDFIAQRSRFFMQETYLPQYNYTVLQGATLYSVENSGTQQLLSGQLDYSTLSNFLKSSVKLAIGYTYEHTPAFAQEERNDWDRNQFLLNVGLISNFSRKIEISINSSTDLNRLKSKQSEASDMLNERVSLGVRTSIIPKFTLKATLSHSYYKQFTDNQQTNNTTLEASIARKLGKNIDFSLNGYNLLDSQKSETLLKTAEYTGFSRIATTGRCIMASLSYKF